ncbi:MAG: hypothetical protein ACI8QT_000998 [Halioglobus sp.]|jgi:hypothetical protein
MKSSANTLLITGARASALYALALVFAMASNELVHAEDEQATTPEATPAIAPDSEQLKAIRSAVEIAESGSGAYAVELPEQLLSMGLALQRESRHTDAVTVFKRGSHLARINNGLYSAEQIPFLEREIASHLALGEYTEADKGQSRLYRVQKRSLANSEYLVDALMQQADWQRRAYKLNIGGEEMSFTHLLYMWDLNRMALTTVIEREGDKSSNLLSPLYAMLQAQYLISSHNDHTKSTNYDFSSGVGSRQSYARFNNYLTKSYDMGRSIIGAVHGIQVSHYGEKSLPTIEARILLGDWMLWHGARDPALASYTLAFRELAELDDAQLQTQRLLGAPVPLPDFDGVRPLLPEVGANEGNILVEFGVSARGKVVDLNRVREDNNAEFEPDEATEGKANRLLRALRKTTFRPSFANGEPTPTENIVKAYAIPE